MALQNITALRKEMVKVAQEQNQPGGAEQALRNAEFHGTTVGQGTLARRNVAIETAATELDNMLPVVTAASRAVDRTQYPSVNKILLAYKEGTGDTKVNALGQALQTTINLWARTTNPTGQLHVHDQTQGEKILQRAWSTGQIESALNMMRTEAQVARNAPAEVRLNLRKQFLKQFGVENTAPPADYGKPSAPSSVWDVQEMK